MPSDCIVTGTLLDSENNPKSGVRLTITPISVSGALVWSGSFKSDLSDAAGLVSFVCIQGGRFNIRGEALEFTGSGMDVTIPSSPTATLESFVAGESYTIEGLTVYGPSGALSGLYQTLKLLGDVTVVQESPGVASATFTGGEGGGGGTWGSITGTLSNQTDLQAALDAKQNSLGYTAENQANKNQNSGYAGLDSSGKINPSQLPAIAISSFLGSVASQAAMLALSGQEGDWAIRTDTNTTWVIVGADPTQLSSWQQLSTPTDLVSSVFGRTGAVTAQANDYTWAQVDKTTSSLADITTRSAADLSSGILPLARLSGITNAEISNSAAIALSKLSITGTPDGTKFLRDDGSWQAVGGSVSYPLLAPDGSAAAPSYSFSGSTGSGMFMSGTYGFGLAYAGAIKLALGSRAYIFNMDVAVGPFSGMVWNTGSDFLSAYDLGIHRNASAVAEINNSVPGQWGALKVGTRDAGTNTVTNGLTIGHQSTGTPAAGLGSALLFNINSSTTADQNAAQLAALWTNATHASRTADFTVSLVNGAAALAEAMRVKADTRLLLGVPNSAPTDGDIANSFATFYLDQAGNNLKVRVRYSDGTYKTGTVALT